MAYRALGTVSLGYSPSVHAGDDIPATYLSVDGSELPVDFERLVELGVAEEVTAKPESKRKTPAKAGDGERKRASSDDHSKE